MNRRGFLKLAGAGAVGAAVAAQSPATVAAVLATTKPKPTVLPHVHPGDMLDPAAHNNLIDRVNELSTR